MIGIGNYISWKNKGFDWDAHWATQWYGIQIDESDSSPDLTRIASTDKTNGDQNIYSVLPVHSLLKGCLLNDDGTVNYYLDSEDWTKKEDGTASNLDGTDGQVMIEWPDFYYKYESISATVWQIKISLIEWTGFTRVYKHYVSAYQAAMNRSTNKLASVVNTTTTYRGGDNSAAADGTDATRIGMCVTNITRTNARTYARARGTGWNLYSYNDHKWMFWFFAIEFATLHTQKTLAIRQKKLLNATGWTSPIYTIEGGYAISPLFRNNQITSNLTSGYIMKAGEETSDANDNHLDDLS